MNKNAELTPLRQSLLMCSPQFFAVDYVINPWMQSGLGQVDAKLAMEQWQNLYQTLSEHADIQLIDPQPGLPDLVFTANAGMVLGNQAIVSRFRSKERQGETPHFETWFRNFGFSVAEWPEHIPFEGAGDALLDRIEPIIWAGYGFRSDMSAHPFLAKIFGREVISLQLTDSRFYHLDTCFCPLPGGYTLYFPDAFSADSLAKIESRIAPEKRIVIGESDALQFSCNAVDLDGVIFMNGASKELQTQLSDAGFKSVIVPLGEFLKAGGTAKCLTLKLVEADIVERHAMSKAA